jgi:hypothetical protein
MPTPRTPKTSARCDVLFAQFLDQLDAADALEARGDHDGASRARATADELREAHREIGQ